MAVFVVRAFVRMRRTMAAHKEMGEKLSDLERRVMGHDEAIRSLVQTIRQLMAPPEKPRRSIGFKVEEGQPVYRRPRRRNAR
jgi:ATP-dependent Clp protease ATP-binding subunit ClpA